MLPEFESFGLRFRCVILLALFLMISVNPAAGGDKWSAERFDVEIAPLLATRCLSCHHGNEPKGGLDLSKRAGALEGGETGTAIVPGDLNRSAAWQRVSDGDMPPEDELDDREKALLKSWIDHGAIWGTDSINPLQFSSDARAGYDWWSLQPLRTVPVPTSADHPIDAFVRRRLADHDLAPSPRATPREIVRRLSFDLIGLPPSPERVASFLRSYDQDPTGAIESFVDELLDSEHYGERWARHWLDVARFGESQGFERDKLRPDSWHFRDWVIRALNDDMPFDEFARLQLAGDLIQPGHPDSVIATGFLVAGPWDEVGQKMQSDAMRAVVRQDEMEDYVGTVGQAFLGLTFNCARCHDHKFDPISQKEYYRLAASMAGVHHGSREVQAPDGAKLKVYAASPSTPDATYLLARGNPAQKVEPVTAGGIASISGLSADFGLDQDASDGERRVALANWITSQRNPLFARVAVNRLWHYHFGVGIVDTPNDFGFSGGRPSHPDLLDFLAEQLIESGFRLKPIHRLIVTSEAYLQSSRFRGDAAAVDADNRRLWRKKPMRLDAEVLRDTILAVTGQLNPQIGGPPYQDFTTYVSNSQFYEMVDKDSPDVYRRTIYRTWIRSGRNHLLDVFDCPDPSTTSPKRSVTTTPLQSLSLMNNSFVLRMSDRFAERVSNEVGEHHHDAIGRVYQLAYGREPTRDEIDLGIEFLRQQELAAYCRAILNSNEFIYVD